MNVGLALQQRSDDAFGRAAVAVGVDRPRHGRVVQQAVRLGDDPAGIGAHQARRAGLDPLRPLGRQERSAVRFTPMFYSIDRYQLGAIIYVVEDAVHSHP